MDNQRLHPNLARLAAAYDEIVAEFNRNRITKEEARRRVLELIGRDDQGVLWRLNPNDGCWARQTMEGQWIPDSPPTYGVATPSAFDVSPVNYHPGRNVVTEQVEENPGVAGGHLNRWRGDTGIHEEVNEPASTRSLETRSPTKRFGVDLDALRSNPKALALTGIAVVVILVLAVAGRGMGSKDAPATTVPSEDSATTVPADPGVTDGPIVSLGAN